MRFQALASSSHGNAYLIDDGVSRILLECGISRRKLQKLCPYPLTGLSGVLVSHEHMDHAKCAKELILDGLRVCMSEGTALALGLEGAQPIAAGEQFALGSFDIMPFTTFHDAQEPLGFVFRSRVDKDVLVFATDTVNLRYRFPGMQQLAIEANYDKQILERCERMPEKVKHRIQRTHMDIDTLCDILHGMDLSQCQKIWLLHLSDAMSHEGHFINKVKLVIPPGICVEACARGG